MSDPLTPFRDPERLRSLTERLSSLRSDKPLAFMHVCGTHENAIGRFGIRSLLPAWLRIIAGPGCPVCVCPPAEIDVAVRLATEHGVILTTFGDMVRVPGRISLAEARARGADVRVVRGVHEAVRLAEEHPERSVVMLAVGFETTACTTAAAVLAEPPENFGLILAHRLIPPAMHALLDLEQLRLDGFLLPGHATTVTGTADYEDFTAQSGLPASVAGFEPVDILLGLERLATLAVEGRVEVANAYARAVRPAGNVNAQRATATVFEPTDAAWRGLGVIPASGLALREPYARYDALERFDLTRDPDLPECLPGCQCGQVMVGLTEPEACPLFDKACTPTTPRGPCMVSLEGTCRSRYIYREVVGE
jgi:hydrogenase expression/formation protein HypD